MGAHYDQVHYSIFKICILGVTFICAERHVQDIVSQYLGFRDN